MEAPSVRVHVPLSDSKRCMAFGHVAGPGCRAKRRKWCSVFSSYGSDLLPGLMAIRWGESFRFSSL